MKYYALDYDRNPHQKEFDEDLVTRFLHLSCGFGGGKSFAVAMKAFKLSWLNRDIDGGCVVPSLPEYKRDLHLILEELLENANIKYRYHKTDKWWKFPWTKGKMWVVTAERKIRGPNWGWGIINEATLLSKKSYDEAKGRVRIRGAPCPQLASSGTPEGRSHWAYDIFVSNPLQYSRIIYGDTRHNAHNLDPTYIPSLETSYDQAMLDAYLRGLFVNMNSNRFYYAYDPNRNDDETLERLIGQEVIVTLDYNVAPMVATLWHMHPLKDPSGGWILNRDGTPSYWAGAFDQIVIKDGADTHKMCVAFKANDLDPEMTIIYPDPHGKSRSTQGPPDNEILKQHGYTRIKVKLAAPRFRKRQLATNNGLEKGLVKINPKKCTYLKLDFEGVEQDQATYEKLKDNAKLTHASDGFDYFFDIEFPLSGQKPETRVIKVR